MIIPDEGRLHWSRVRLSFQLQHSHYDLAAFRATLGAQEEEDSWILGEVGGKIHSHASLLSRDDIGLPSDAQEEMFPAYLIDIVSYRIPPDEQEDIGTLISHDEFFRALNAAVTGEDHVHAVSSVDLLFQASVTRWRMKLLSDPPKFDEVQSELGRISLGGLTLRFDNSSVGLFEANLAISPSQHEYLCTLTFLQHFHLSSLDTTYSAVLAQAEEFSSAFLIERVTDGNEA